MHLVVLLFVVGAFGLPIDSSLNLLDVPIPGSPTNTGILSADGIHAAAQLGTSLTGTVAELCVNVLGANILCPDSSGGSAAILPGVQSGVVPPGSGVDVPSMPSGDGPLGSGVDAPTVDCDNDGLVGGLLPGLLAALPHSGQPPAPPSGHSGPQPDTAGHTGPQPDTAGHTGSQPATAGHTGSQPATAGQPSKQPAQRPSQQPAAQQQQSSTPHQPPPPSAGSHKPQSGSHKPAQETPGPPHAPGGHPPASPHQSAHQTSSQGRQQPPPADHKPANAHGPAPQHSSHPSKSHSSSPTSTTRGQSESSTHAAHSSTTSLPSAKTSTRVLSPSSLPSYPQPVPVPTTTDDDTDDCPLDCILAIADQLAGASGDSKDGSDIPVFGGLGGTLAALPQALGHQTGSPVSTEPADAVGGSGPVEYLPAASQPNTTGNHGPLDDAPSHAPLLPDINIQINGEESGCEECEAQHQ